MQLKKKSFTTFSQNFRSSFRERNNQVQYIVLGNSLRARTLSKKHCHVIKEKYVGESQSAHHFSLQFTFALSAVVLSMFRLFLHRAISGWTEIPTDWLPGFFSSTPKNYCHKPRPPGSCYIHYIHSRPKFGLVSRVYTVLMYAFYFEDPLML